MANVLQIGVDQVKNAVSVYCRLGFARKKNAELEPGTLHPSWKNVLNTSPNRTSSVSSVPSDEDPLLAELAAALAELGTPLPTEKEGNIDRFLNFLFLFCNLYFGVWFSCSPASGWPSCR